MWEFEDSIETPATRERVWALATDVPSWPSWNPGVGRAGLGGPLAEGATGTPRPHDLAERAMATESAAEPR